MENTIDSTAVLGWYTGKNLVEARAALADLTASLAAGEWLPGVSRYVASRLAKANVAAKLAKKVEHKLANFRVGDQRGWEVTHCLQFGLMGRIQNVDAAHLSSYATDDEVRAFLLRAADYRAAFGPVARAIESLNATRPRPVFTYLGASPTVTKTLEGFGAAETNHTVKVELCPIKWGEVWENGKRTYVAWLEWPANTNHGTSRFHAFDQQCEACGHGIKTCNWVPLVVRVEGSEIPRSLWVGRDCARTLFGIVMKGDLEVKLPDRP